MTQAKAIQPIPGSSPWNPLSADQIESYDLDKRREHIEEMLSARFGELLLEGHLGPEGATSIARAFSAEDPVVLEQMGTVLPSIASLSEDSDNRARYERLLAIVKEAKSLLPARTTLPAQVAVTEKCRACTELNPPKAKFCTKCGLRFDRAPSASVVGSPAQPLRSAVTAVDMPASTTTPDGAPENPPPQPPVVVVPARPTLAGGMTPATPPPPLTPAVGAGDPTPDPNNDRSELIALEQFARGSRPPAASSLSPGAPLVEGASVVGPVSMFGPPQPFGSFGPPPALPLAPPATVTSPPQPPYSWNWSKGIAMTILAMVAAVSVGWYFQHFIPWKQVVIGGLAVAGALLTYKSWTGLRRRNQPLAATVVLLVGGCLLAALYYLQHILWWYMTS